MDNEALSEFIVMTPEASVTHGCEVNPWIAGEAPTKEPPIGKPIYLPSGARESDALSGLAVISPGTTLNNGCGDNPWKSGEAPTTETPMGKARLLP